MKIGIVIRCCRNFGSSRYVVETSKYFARDNELHVFTNNWDPLDKRITIHRIPTIPSNYYIYEGLFFSLSTLALKFHSFDVTLAQPTRYLSPDVGEMQFVYREWLKYVIKNKMYVSPGGRILALIERHNIKKAKKLIAISNRVKNDILKNYTVPEEKVRVIYSGVNLEEFNPKHRSKYGEEIRKQYNIPLDDLVLLFIGHPFHRKGLEFLIRSLPLVNLNNIKVLVFGKDDPEPYQKLISNLRLQDKIIFHTSLTSEIYKYFAASDIFVLPTLYEPFGLVILEAMASGLPVVTSQIAGAAEIIEDERDGLWLKNPKDFKEIAEKLNYLIINDKVRKQIGKKARKKAEQYSWERTAKGMLEVFEEVAKV